MLFLWTGYRYSKVGKKLKVSSQMGFKSWLGITLSKEERVVVLELQGIPLQSGARQWAVQCSLGLVECSEWPAIHGRPSTQSTGNRKDFPERWLYQHSSVELGKYVLGANCVCETLWWWEEKKGAWRAQWKGPRANTGGLWTVTRLLARQV